MHQDPKAVLLYIKGSSRELSTEMLTAIPLAFVLDKFKI